MCFVSFAHTLEKRIIPVEPVQLKPCLKANYFRTKTSTKSLLHPLLVNWYGSPTEKKMPSLDPDCCHVCIYIHIFCVTMSRPRWSQHVLNQFERNGFWCLRAQKPQTTNRFKRSERHSEYVCAITVIWIWIQTVCVWLVLFMNDECQAAFAWLLWVHIRFALVVAALLVQSYLATSIFAFIRYSWLFYWCHRFGLSLTHGHWTHVSLNVSHTLSIPSPVGQQNLY